jgi:hypothetical protein
MKEKKKRKENKGREYLINIQKDLVAGEGNICNC